VVRHFFLANETAQTIACSANYLGFASMSFKSVNLCILRIVCIADMAFLEETVGERTMIWMTNGLGFLLGSAATAALAVMDETRSGIDLTKLLFGRKVFGQSIIITDKN
jgi:hypothetical protein